MAEPFKQNPEVEELACEIAKNIMKNHGVKHMCAQSVRLALKRVGIMVEPLTSAKEYGQNLVDAGFSEIKCSLTECKPGDIVVFSPPSKPVGNQVYGHIQIKGTDDHFHSYEKQQWSEPWKNPSYKVYRLESLPDSCQGCKIEEDIKVENERGAYYTSKLEELKDRLSENLSKVITLKNIGSTAGNSMAGSLGNLVATFDEYKSWADRGKALGKNAAIGFGINMTCQVIDGTVKSFVDTFCDKPIPGLPGGTSLLLSTGLLLYGIAEIAKSKDLTISKKIGLSITLAGETGVQIGASILGQILIPIPLLGSFIGGLIGGLLVRYRGPISEFIESGMKKIYSFAHRVADKIKAGLRKLQQAMLNVVEAVDRIGVGVVSAIKSFFSVITSWFW